MQSVLFELLMLRCNAITFRSLFHHQRRHRHRMREDLFIHGNELFHLPQVCERYVVTTADDDDDDE